MTEWLKVFMNIEKECLMPRLSINIIHKFRIQKILKFWSNLLGLPVDSFGKLVFIKTSLKKIYDNHANYFGIIRLGVKNSTLAQHKILSLIEILKGDMSG